MDVQQQSEEFVKAHLPGVLANPSSLKSVAAELLSYHLPVDVFITVINELMFGTPFTEPPTEALRSLNVPSKICGKMIDVIWFCEQCCLDGTSCYCNECFDKEKHKGHTYNYVVGGSGLCDCGDKTAIKPEGFCKVHTAFQEEAKILEQFLPLIPGHIRQTAPIAIKVYMGLLHEALTKELASKANVKAALAVAQTVLSYLGYICGVSPIFQHWIEEGFDAVFPEHSTVHKCKTKYFVSPHQKSVYEQTMKDLVPAKAPPATEGMHPCTCSVLELIMGLFPLLIQQDEIYAFISQLIKQRSDFPPKALLAFCQNMYSVLTYLEVDRLEQFETSLSQFLNGAWAEFVVKNPDYTPVLFTMCRDFFAYCEVAGGKSELASILFVQIFSPFLSERPGKIVANQPEFWSQFVAAAASNELLGYSDKLELHSPTLAKTAGIHGIFMLLTRQIEIRDEKLISHILVQLKGVMEKSETTATAYLADKNYFALECERMWGWILSMMLTHYLLEKEVSGDPVSIRNQFRERVMRLMKVEDSARFDSFIDDTMNVAVKLMSFVTKFKETPQLQEFMNTRYFGRDIEHFLYSDTCVLNMTLLLSAKPWRLLELVDTHFKLDWDGKSMEKWSAAEIRPVNDQLELMLYLLLSAVGNDFIMLYEYFLGTFQNRGMNVIYRYRGKELLDYLTPKRIVNIYMKRDKLFADLKCLDSELDVELRKEDLSETIDSMFEKKKAAKDILFSLKESALPCVNILWDGSFSGLAGYEEKLKLVLDHISSKGKPRFNALEWMIFKPLEPVYDFLAKSLLSMGVFQRLARLIAGHGRRISENAGVLAGMLMYRLFRQAGGVEEKEVIRRFMGECTGVVEALKRLAGAHPAFDVGIKHMLTELTGPTEEDENDQEGSAMSESDKEKTKEKQKAIMAQFAAKQKVFMQKQGEPRNEEEEKKGQKPEGKDSKTCCVICREELRTETFVNNPFGLLVSHSFNGGLIKAGRDLIGSFIGSTKQGGIVNVTSAPSLESDEYLSSYSSCGHYSHLKCTQTYIAKNPNVAYMHKNNGIFPCPMCNSICKIVLPEIPESESVPRPATLLALKGSEEYAAHLGLVMRNTFVHGETDYSAEKFLPVLISAIANNVDSISLLGDVQYQKHRSGPLKLFVRVAIHYLLISKMAGSPQALIATMQSLMKTIESALNADDILTKNPAKLTMELLLLAQFIDLLSGNSRGTKLSSEESYYKSSVFAIVSQIVLKELNLYWCQKQSVSRGNPDFVLDKPGVRNKFSLELSKLRACLELFGGSKEGIDKFSRLLESLADESMESVTHVLGFPVGTIESPTAHKVEFAFSQAGSVAGKVTIPAPVIFSGTMKSLRFVTLPSTFRKFYEEHLAKCCPTCPSKCNNTCVCMFCGGIVCSGDCCIPEEVSLHALNCVGGDGVFIDVKTGKMKMSCALGVAMLDSIYTNSVGQVVNSIMENSRYAHKDTTLEEYRLNQEEVKRWEEVCVLGGVATEVLRAVLKNAHQFLISLMH